MINSTPACREMNDVLYGRGELTTLLPTKIVFAVIYSLIVILSVLGNSCVILAVLKNKPLQSVRNLFIVSLSCSDIVVALTSGTITPFYAFTKKWLLGKNICRLSTLVPGMSICISTFTLTLIAVDRYILVVFPTRQPIQRTHAVAIIAVIWLLAATIAAPAVYFVDTITYPQYCGEYCSENWNTTRGNGTNIEGGDFSQLRRAYGTWVVVLTYFVPLAIICVCYISIVVKLDRSVYKRSCSVMSYDRRTAAMRRRRRTNRMLICMVVIFAGCYFWNMVFNLLRDYKLLPSQYHHQPYFIGILLHCIATSSTLWNPVLYAWLNDQLRLGFISLFPWFFAQFGIKGDKCSRSLSTVTVDDAQVSMFNRLRRRSSFDWLRSAHQPLANNLVATVSPQFCRAAAKVTVSRHDAHAGGGRPPNRRAVSFDVSKQSGTELLLRRPKTSSAAAVERRRGGSCMVASQPTMETLIAEASDEELTAVTPPPVNFRRWRHNAQDAVSVGSEERKLPSAMNEWDKTSASGSESACKISTLVDVNNCKLNGESVGSELPLTSATNEWDKMSASGPESSSNNSIAVDVNERQLNCDFARSQLPLPSAANECDKTSTFGPESACDNSAVVDVNDCKLNDGSVGSELPLTAAANEWDKTSSSGPESASNTSIAVDVNERQLNCDFARSQLPLPLAGNECDKTSTSGPESACHNSAVVDVNDCKLNGGSVWSDLPLPLAAIEWDKTSVSGPESASNNSAVVDVNECQLNGDSDRSELPLTPAAIEWDKTSASGSESACNESEDVDVSDCKLNGGSVNSQLPLPLAANGWDKTSVVGPEGLCNNNTAVDDNDTKLYGVAFLRELAKDEWDSRSACESESVGNNRPLADAKLNGVSGSSNSILTNSAELTDVLL